MFIVLYTHTHSLIYVNWCDGHFYIFQCAPTILLLALDLCCWPHSHFMSCFFICHMRKQFDYFVHLSLFRNFYHIFFSLIPSSLFVRLLSRIRSPAHMICTHAPDQQQKQQIYGCREYMQYVCTSRMENQRLAKERKNIFRSLVEKKSMLLALAHSFTDINKYR